MALKLDENYSGPTLLSTWWRQVKNNFAAVKAFVDALETDKANTTDVEKALKNKADATAVTNALEDKADKTELHKHNNKSILDGITQDTVDGWQKMADAVDDLNKEMSGEYESGLSERINENSDKIGNLDDLPTVDKSSIVNAIIALKKLIGSGGTTGTDAALKIMTDYSLEYAKEGVYAKDPIDNMPLGLYIFSPTQDIEHIFLVSADGENELAVLSEPLYQNNVYILRFGSDSSEIIAGFGSSGIDMSEIDETLSAINEDIEELRRKQAAHFAICTDSRNTLAKTVTVSDSELILTDGLQITIRFNNGLRSTTIAEGITTLNINNTGSKDLLIGGIDNTTAEDSTGKIYVDNNGVITVVYDKAMDAYTIVGRESFNGSGTGELADAVIKERHIADGAVGADQLKDISVGTKKIIDGAITEEKLSVEVKTKLDAAGTPGKSAYEIAVAEGFKGSIAEWLDSLQGEQGPQGVSGVYVGSGDMPDGYNIQIDPDGKTAGVWDELLKGAQLKPEFANSIEECTDTSKWYVLPDGYIWAYMESTSTETTDDISLLWSYGAKIDKTTGAESQSDLYAASDYITINKGSTYTLSRALGYNSSIAICYYDEDKRYMSYEQVLDNAASGIGNEMISEISFEPAEGAIYFRLRVYNDTGTAEDFCPTVMLKRICTSTSILGWHNTGHAFVPANYEDRIVALEKAILGGNDGVLGYVDENNNILITGKLKNGTYILKYENNGEYSEIGKLTIN